MGETNTEKYRSTLFFGIDTIPINRDLSLFDRRKWKRDLANLSFQAIQKKERLQIRSYRRHGANGKKRFAFLG